jgi:hypothetical protein
LIGVTSDRSDDGLTHRIYEEGLIQIEFTKQNGILGFAQFRQQACPFAFALQQERCLEKRGEAFIDSKYV